MYMQHLTFDFTPQVYTTILLWSGDASDLETGKNEVNIWPNEFNPFTQYLKDY